MRFMLLMIPNVSPAEWAEGPSAERAAEMGAFNQALTDAGALLALDGLHPPAEGARVARDGGETRVSDVPVVAGQTVGGYWIVDVASLEDAVGWARRVPLGEGDAVEVRRVYEMSDHPADVQAAAELSAQPPEQTAAR